MSTNYFHTTKDLSYPSPFILKHSKRRSPALADILFRKNLCETAMIIQKNYMICC